ncbi:MAG: hypothetical protein K0U21_00785 [Proteobacteria bacterium]|jgi:hypothetical protein|nr:hypothetical protein [Pseudomonadota bacterium]
MEELTYKSIMNDKERFDQFIALEDIKAQIKSVEKIDTAGAQIILGLLKEEKIELSDLSDNVQNELLFLGVNNG